MKHFYTLLVMAMASVCAGAAENQQLAAQQKFGAREIDNGFELQQAAAVDFSRAVNPISRAGAVIDNPSTIDGNYLWSGYGMVQGETTNDVEALWYMTSKANGNKISIGDFIYKGTTFTGDFDPVAQTLTFPLGIRATYTSSSGQKTDLTLYEYDFDTKTASPLTLYYSDTFHGWVYDAPYDNSYMYTKAMVYAIADSQIGYGVQAALYVSRMSLFNAQMAHLGQYNPTTGSFENPEYFNIYMGKASENTLILDNLFDLGFGYNASFLINTTNQTVIGNEPIIGQNSQGGPICLLGVDSEGYGVAESVFKYSEKPGANGAIDKLLICNAVGVVDGFTQEGTRYNGVQILCPFNPFEGAGVENIEVDSSNAPVEYFNLQGMPVANPENGLYIRRQGKKVSKVLVK